MFFERIRRKAGIAGLLAAFAVAVPAMPATAAVGGQPTPLTITPDFASRVAAKPATDRSASGEYQVAQSGDIRRLRRGAGVDRRDVRRQVRREARRDVRSDRRNWRRDARVSQRDRRWDRRHFHNGRWYYGRGSNWYDDSGAWVAAGLIGLAAGAIAGSALSTPSYGNTVVVTGVPPQFSAEWYRQCDVKYRSFRASDGTFLGYDGIRRVCRLP